MKYNPVLLEKTRQALDKSMIRYIRDDDAIYKALKWVCYVMIYWANFFNIVYIASHSMKLNSTEITYADSDIAKLKNIMYFAIILFAAFTVGYVLLLCKKYLAAHIVNIISAGAGMVYFNGWYAGDLSDNGMGSAFHYRHGFPYMLMIVAAGFLLYFSIRQSMIEKKSYIEFSEKIYKKHSDKLSRLSDDTMAPILLSDSEWREFINEYSDDLYAPQKLKRSRKAKLRKNQQKDAEE